MKILKYFSAFCLAAYLLCGYSAAQAADTPENAYQEYIRKIQDYKLDFYAFPPAIQEKVIDKFIDILKAKGVEGGDQMLQSFLSKDRESIKKEIYNDLKDPDSSLSKTFRTVIHNKLVNFTDIKVKDTVIKGSVAYLYLDNGRYIKAFLKNREWEVDLLGSSLDN